MNSVDRLLCILADRDRIETELTVMDITVMGTQQATDDQGVNAYALQTFNGWVN